jgi:hypothetical protein
MMREGNDDHQDAVRVPPPRSAGLLLSYRCNASCLHCMYACSPRWQADWIGEERLERLLRQLARFIEPAPGGADDVDLNHGLHFTGGEPFLNADLLEKAAARAAELGIPSLFAETNAFWAVDEDRARSLLERLKRAGLQGILISVNPFYLEHVPFERTRNAVHAAADVFDEGTMVYQPAYFRFFSLYDISGTMSFDRYLRDFEPGFPAGTEFFLNGRAPYLVPPLAPESFSRRPAEELLDEPCRPAFVRSWHNHVDNYGNYQPGYCGGLSWGDAGELDRLVGSPVDAERTPVLARIAAGDFRGLLELARREGFEPHPAGYYSKCHLCGEIRLHLHGRGGYPELLPDGFYRELREARDRSAAEAQ